jgi:hypothetical protein
VKNDNKKHKEQETNKNSRRSNKTSEPLGADLFCDLCDHPDPFNGALGSFKILAKTELL